MGNLNLRPSYLIATVCLHTYGGGGSQKWMKMCLRKIWMTPSDKSSFEFKTKSKEDKECNLKISTWNVAGLRAWIKKDGLDFLQNEKPDVICLQEIKCSKAKLPAEIKVIQGV